MEYFSLMPAAMCCIITIYIIVGSFDKSDDYIMRFWKILFGIVLTLVTVYLTNVGMDEIKKINRESFNKSYKSQDSGFVY